MDSDGRKQEPLMAQLATFFDGEEWQYDRVKGEPMLHMGFKGENARWYCFAQVREEFKQLLFYSVLLPQTPPDRLYAMAEFVARVNYGLAMGNFELDFDDGEVRFKTALDASEMVNEALADRIRSLVYANLISVDHYHNGLVRIMETDVPPEQVAAELDS